MKKNQGIPIELLLWLWEKSKSKYLGILIRPLYRIYNIVLGIDIPYKVKCGKNLTIYHPLGIVINKDVTIGDNCIIRHNTTIGSKNSENDCPSIGSNVDIGCNALILGKIKIGDNVIIGAGSVVLKDVENNAIVAGNPAKIIKFRD